MNESGQSIDKIPVTPEGLVELLALVERGTINLTSAREVLAEMVASGQSAAAVVEARGLTQISDETALAAAVDRVLSLNPEPLASYLAGKESLLGWFVGQVMQATNGRANPALVRDLLQKQLDERKGST